MSPGRYGVGSYIPEDGILPLLVNLQQCIKFAENVFQPHAT
jgi:hypothetical protein